MNSAIKLVPFLEAHFSKTFEWINNLEFQRKFLMRSEPNWDDHTSYCRRTISDPRQVVYAISFGENHIGNCGYKNILEDKAGELWIYIGSSSNCGKGFGMSATRLLIEEGYKQLNFRMIYLHVADFNVTAIRMYKKLGFIEVPLKENADDWSERGCRIIRMEVKREQ